MGCSDAIVASSTVEAGQLQELYGADPARVEVVVPGVDHEMFSPGDKLKARAELGIDGDAPMLLFVGRIQRLKGVDIAIEALAQLAPPVHLVVVGGPSGDDGEDEMRRLKTLVRACSLDGRVRFVAPQPHDHLSTYYRAADACLVPSRSESFGLVALEAAACGTPVVASAVGGLRTLVDDGRTGFLVEAGEATHLATAVGQLLGSPGLAAKMGATAAQRSQRYSWSMTAARLRRLCTDLTVSELLECQ
jgi:D-inositol-3-phosphate glycosyltransferase